MEMRGPLVSFCVKCYNQSMFIGEAVDGALSQTYRPIEIIIGDDASTDNSVEIIRSRLLGAGCLGPTIVEDNADSTVQRFDEGSRVIILIQNKTNLGNLGNWQKICSMARGELFIKADGDDISLPKRTVRVVQEWLTAGVNCGVVYHNAVRIDCDGRAIGDMYRDVLVEQLPLGAVMACRRECFSEFNPLLGGAVQDDVVYSRRNALLGYSEVRFNECLVKYRVGSGESTIGRSYSTSLYNSILRTIRTMNVLIEDLKSFRSRLPPGMFEERMRSIETTQKRVMDELPMWESPRLIERIRSFWQVHSCRLLPLKSFVIHVLLMVLPHSCSREILDYIYRVVKIRLNRFVSINSRNLI